MIDESKSHDLNLDETIIPEASGEILDAGLEAAFELNDSVFKNPHGSILKTLSQSLHKVPRVALREAAGEGSNPIVRPKSAELPPDQPDSRYRLDGEIARGGMGAILKGRDVDLGRDLAIKVLLDSHKDQPEVVERFIEEAQIGGQLQHPGIVPVYELGQFSDQRPFFSMKLVKGQTLASLLSKRKDPEEDRAKLLGIFEQVCQTMAYAHSKGVIHRDLKPSNIMVGAFGEVQVMDWGLAKVLSEGGVADEKKSLQKQQNVSVIQTRRSLGSETPLGVGSETQMGSVLGTPAYMPPEQALGEVDRLDERADVFGLGGMLCEILTAKPPYTGEDGAEVYRKASRGKLAECFDRLDQSGADADLIDLNKSMLAAEPDDRPDDASVVSEEISKYLNSVQDRLKEAELDKARSDGKRKMYIAVIVLSLIIANGALLVANKFRAQREEQALLAAQNNTLAEENDQERKEAESARAVAENTSKKLSEERKRLREQLYASLIPQAESAIRAGDRIAARQLLNQCPEDLRHWEWDHLSWRARSRCLITIPGAGIIRFSPQGDLLTRHGGPDRFVRSWKLENGMLIGEYPVEVAGQYQDSRDPGNLGNFILGLNTISNDGKYILTVGDGSTLSLVRIASGRRQWEVDGEISQAGMFSPDDSMFLGKQRQSGAIRLMDSANGQLLQSGSVVQTTRGSEFSPDCSRLAISYGIYEVPSLEKVIELDAATEGLTPTDALAWTPDSQSVVTGDRDGCIRIWDAQTGQRLKMLTGHEGRIRDVVVSLDGRQVASIGWDGTVRLADIHDDTTQELRVIGKHDTGHTWRLAFTSDGSRIVSSGDTRVCRVWPIAMDYESDSLLHSQGTNCVAFNRSGTRIACGNSRGRISVWDVMSRKIVAAFESENSVRDIVWFPDGTQLATECNGVIEVWDIVSADGESRKIDSDQSVSSFAVNSKGTLLAAASRNQNRLQVWNAETGQQNYELPLPESFQARIAWSPTGTELAISHPDSQVTVVEAHTGRVLRKLPITANSVAYSTDSQRLACGMGNEITVLDAQSGRIIHKGKCRNHVMRLQFLDDTRLILLSQVTPNNALRAKEEVSVWNMNPEEELLTLKGHRSALTDFDVSPNGRTVVTSSGDGVRIWETNPTSIEVSGRTEFEHTRQIVDEYFEELKFTRPVIDALNKDTSMTSEVRTIAIELSKIRRDIADDVNEADRLNSSSLSITTVPDHPKSDYRDAIGMAKTASAILPESAIYRSTLGIAQYRVKDYNEALETLRHAERQFFEMHPGRDYPPIVAFLAMTLHQLGRHNEAVEQLDRLQRWFDEDKWGGNRELYLQFQQEAKELILRTESINETLNNS